MSFRERFKKAMPLQFVAWAIGAAIYLFMIFTTSCDMCGMARLALIPAMAFIYAAPLFGLKSMAQGLDNRLKVIITGTVFVTVMSILNTGIYYSLSNSGIKPKCYELMEKEPEKYEYDYDEAKKQVQTYRKQAAVPEEVKELIRQSKDEIDEEQYEKALEMLDKAIALDKDCFEAYMLRGHVKYKLNDIEGSEKDYRDAAEGRFDNPDDYDSDFDKAIVYKRLGKFREAMDCLDRYMAENKDDYFAYVERADVRMQLRDKKGSEADLKTAKDLVAGKGKDKKQKTTIWDIIIVAGSIAGAAAVAAAFFRKSEMYVRVIAHIAVKEEWQNAVKSGAYEPQSVKKEGFIHCSEIKQLVDTANSYFWGKTGLVVLCIDETRLKSKVKYEVGTHIKASGRKEVYPHIYGSLNTDAVIKVVDFRPGTDGKFAFPDALKKFLDQ